MMKRKSRKNVPVYYPKTLILTAEIPAHFETTYASTFMEVSEPAELQSLSTSNEPAVSNFLWCAFKLDLVQPNHHLVQIFHPTAETVFLLNLTDAEKPKATISNRQKLQELERLRKAIDTSFYIKEMFDNYAARAKNFYLYRNHNYMRDTRSEVFNIRQQIVAGRKSIKNVLAGWRKTFLNAFLEY
jgi:hypothetical protein